MRTTKLPRAHLPGGPSGMSLTRLLRVALLGSLGVVGAAGLLGACATTPEPKAESPEAKASSPAPADGELAADCEAFGKRMCERLGPGSGGCRAITQAIQLMPPAACTAAVGDVEYAYARIDALRADCLTVADRLCERVGPESEICQKIRGDMQQAVPPGHCPQLLAEYPQLEANLMQRLDAERPLAAEQRAALVAGDPPSFGPETAAVTLVEFSDFECPYCGMAAETVAEIKQKFGDRVRFVFRQFPLAFHEHAQLAAEASLEAHAQGKFWPMHDLIFEHQNELSADALRDFAQEVELDMAAYDEAMAEDTHAAAVRADLALGKQVHVSGTPTLFLNGERVPNPTEYAEVAPLIEAALANAERTEAASEIPPATPGQAKPAGAAEE